MFLDKIKKRIEEVNNRIISREYYGECYFCGCICRLNKMEKFVIDRPQTLVSGYGYFDDQFNHACKFCFRDELKNKREYKLKRKNERN